MKLKDGYYAKDENEDVFWYEDMPCKGKDCWHYTMISCRLLYCIQIDDPWEDSLHKVEDGVITKIQTFKKDQKVLVSCGSNHSMWEPNACTCGNPEWGFDCVCKHVADNPGDTHFSCEYCGLYTAGKPRCNKCEE